MVIHLSRSRIKRRATFHDLSSMHIPQSPSIALSLLTTLTEGTPAGDPAEQVRLQLVSRRRQAGRSSMSSQQHGGRPVQLQQGQVIVVVIIVVVLVKVDLQNSHHFLSRAAAIEQEFTQVDRPHRGGVETAGGEKGLLCVTEAIF